MLGFARLCYYVVMYKREIYCIPRISMFSLIVLSYLKMGAAASTGGVNNGLTTTNPGP